MSKVSIITASYNYENYIKETIESVINQTFQDWELIVVDDGSTDNSVEIIKSYCKKDNRIKLFQHKNGENKGIAETLKLGIQKSSSPWIVFLESDDTITSDYLSKKFDIINKYPNVDFIFNNVNMLGDIKIINKKNIEYFNVVLPMISKLKYPNKMFKAFKKFRSSINIIPTFSVVMLKRQILNKNYFNSTLKPCLYWYIWLQIVSKRKYNFFYIDKNLTNWRIHNDSYLGSYIKNEKKFKQKDIFLFEIKKSIFLFDFIGFFNAIRIGIIIFNFKEKKIIFFGKEYKIHLLFKILNKRITILGKTVFHIHRINSKKIINIFGVKFGDLESYKNKKEKDISIITKSGFWNDDWYIKKYHPELNKEQALDYWYEKGLWSKELPSKYFNCDYLSYCIDIGENPIIQYLKYGSMFCFPNNSNPYKSEKDKNRIEEYLAYKKTRKAKGVVYTCITNDYDDIREIKIYKYIDKDWDYVCFTDNKNYIKQKQIGIWEIKPLLFDKLDNTRNQRWHKTNPNTLFPQYEQSIWLDGNINVLSNKLFETIYKSNSNLLVTEHFKNTCIYQEYEDVLKYELDNSKIINEEKNLIEQDNMPINWGMPETNILYRKHNDERIIYFNEKWWNIIERYSKRDQLSVSYIMWKTGFLPKDCFMKNSRILVYDFYLFSHKKQIVRLTR